MHGLGCGVLEGVQGRAARRKGTRKPGLILTCCRVESLGQDTCSWHAGGRKAARTDGWMRREWSGLVLRSWGRALTPQDS